MILFVHIPKCGGKSFRSGLEQAYNDELVLHYNNPLKKHPIHNAVPVFIRHNIKKMMGRLVNVESAKLIYGHYCFDDFPELIKDQSTLCGAFFRDPIEWLGSYLFYMQQKHMKDIKPEHIIKHIKKNQLDKGYALFLGSLKVDSLDYIGIVEDYENSLKLYKSITGVDILPHYINQTQNAPKSYKQYFMDQGVLQDVFNIMEENIEIYQQALKRYSSLKKEYKVQPN